MVDERKTAFTFLIGAFPYDPMSGGVRALYLLGHYLHRAGFRTAIVVGGPVGGGEEAPAWLEAPVLHELPLGLRDGVAIYPETFGGNPLGTPHVIRYLLNKPGARRKDTSHSYGAEDLFISFDRSHIPEGRSGRVLYLPLVDRRYYHLPEEPVDRQGSALCTKLTFAGHLGVPPWLMPVTTVTTRNPMSHRRLGSLYRRSRAFLAFARTSAIYEALCCGCPVVCYPSDNFNPEVYQPRFGGAGLSWSTREADFEAAAASVPSFIEEYGRIERETPAVVEQTFLDIAGELLARTGCR